MKALPRLLSLRTWVALLLVTAVLLTLLGVSAVLMLYRLPQIEALQRGEIAERGHEITETANFEGPHWVQVWAVGHLMRPLHCLF